MWESILDHGVVVDFFVAGDVVDETAKILLGLCWSCDPLYSFEEAFGNWQVSSAEQFSFNADVLVSSMLIIAKESQALR